MSDTQQTKVCSICKQEKPFSDYHMRSSKECWPKSACKVCSREKAKGYWRKNPLPKTVQRERNLQKSFGIGVEEWNLLFESQGGLCAICGASSCGTGRNFAVDHCHTTGKIRGLLCAACNKGLGLFKDREEELLKAVDYLRKNG